MHAVIITLDLQDVSQIDGPLCHFGKTQRGRLEQRFHTLALYVQFEFLYAQILVRYRANTREEAYLLRYLDTTTRLDQIDATRLAAFEERGVFVYPHRLPSLDELVCWERVTVGMAPEARQVDSEEVDSLSCSLRDLMKNAFLLDSIQGAPLLHCHITFAHHSVHRPCAETEGDIVFILA
jgi:hypothetical protein